MKFRSIWVGIAALCVVMYLGVFSGFSDLSIFFNVHAIALVFGGTIAITLLSYSFAMISEIFDFLIYGFFLKKTSHETDVVLDLMTSIYKTKSPFFEANSKKYEHIFIKDGINLIRNPKMSSDEVYDALQMRIEKFRVKYQAHAKVLLNISKYPPALGLLGASTGMIQMMMNLGTGGPDAIGKAMAVALTATFWGIGIANFIFLPLADYAFQLAEDDNQTREIIADAIVKEKEGVSFDSLVEIITYKLNAPDQMHIKRELNNFLAKETKGAADLNARAEAEGQVKTEASMKSLADAHAFSKVEKEEDKPSAPKKAS